MKKIIFTLALAALSFQFLFATGVCIIDAAAETYFQLESSNIEIEINNQVTTTISTQTFLNNSGQETEIKYGFPMTFTASATQLRWKVDGGFWKYASFQADPQDPSLPGGGGGGGGVPYVVNEYLGDFPLFFEVEDPIPNGSTITVEITYVDLLPYAFNIVTFHHGGQYQSIQSTPLQSFEINYNLVSSRTIDWVDLIDETNEVVTNSGNEASLTFSKNNYVLNNDIIIEYQLNPQELGLFDLSTFIPDSLLDCDDHGEGFFTLIVEPDPSNNTQTIEKIFTLVIDRSGSMDGNKIVQARDAATFIINNLNTGDEFNIVDFSSNVTSFQPDHVPFTIDNQNAALSYIQGIGASGSTNISGALGTAIEQFQNNDPDKASIIIFFTDGEATAGTTSTSGILQHVANSISANNVQGLSIFAFGIGDNVNQQLLTLLATQNNGFAEFLENQDLASIISEFYLTVQNPVLLNTQVSFDPPAVVEAYPKDLPNLFKGQQLIMVGRYLEAQPITMELSGNAFGTPISYQYNIDLADTLVPQLQFLPRLWAQKKMDHLFTEFLQAGNDTLITGPINDSIVDISFCYGVLSPLTSFSDQSGNQGSGAGGGFSVSVSELFSSSQEEYELVRSFPNPFFQETTFSFLAEDFKSSEPTVLKIMDANGRIVFEITLNVSPDELVQWTWDGTSFDGRTVPPGIYFITIENDNIQLRGKVVKSK